MFTVSELIDYLEQYDGDAEVRIATQPSWPLAFHVANVVSEAEAVDGLGEEEADEDGIDEPRNVVWIATSDGNCGDNPYAPRHVWP